MDEMPEVKEK